MPDELVGHADAIAAWFEARGYRVRVEHKEVAYPYTPTLFCKRQSTTVLVEVDRKPPLERMLEWTRYCRSCNRDTRIALGMPDDVQRSPREDAVLRENGAGLYLVGDAVVEAITPRDLALSMELPKLDAMPKKLQRALGAVYEHFERSHWREGFEEACIVLETHARKYLAKGMRSGRIVLVNKNDSLSKTQAADVARMTLGQLAAAYAKIQIPSHADGTIAQVLARINADRIAVAHYKRTAAAEKRLRLNVGQHMWSVVSALRELL